jgi:hypothetical protein
VTDDSAFKRQVRARMAETGEKYTEARRIVIEDAAIRDMLHRYMEPAGKSSAATGTDCGPGRGPNRWAASRMRCCASAAISAVAATESHLRSSPSAGAVAEANSELFSRMGTPLATARFTASLGRASTCRGPPGPGTTTTA